MEVVTLKLLVAGPFAAGKTTLISAISEIPVVATEAEVTDETRATKLNTTVTMDYGKLTVADDELRAELLMFGTPGQERFSFMWDVLAEGMDGYILVADLSRPESFEEARGILDHFRAMSDVPFVVAANRSSGFPGPVSKFADALGLDPEAVIVPCEAVDRESAKEVVVTMLLEVLAHEGGGGRMKVEELTANGAASTVTTSLDQAILELRRASRDITGVMVASSDGLSLAHDLPPEHNLQTAAMAATAVGLSRRIVETFGHGAFEDAVVRGRDGYLVVYSAGPRGVLAVLADGEANLGLLHHVARRAASRISKLLV